jgi:hypothetical protein
MTGKQREKIIFHANGTTIAKMSRSFCFTRESAMYRRICKSLLIVMGVALLQGCALFAPKQPPPLQKPEAHVALAQFAGTALSGPGEMSISAADAAKAWSVSARLFAVEVLPEDPRLAAIGPQARLVIGHDPATLFSPSSRLAYSTRAGPLGETDQIEPLLGTPGRWIEMRQFIGGVAPGSTISFEIALPQNAPFTASLARRKLTLAVDRRSGDTAYELVLVSEDLLLPQLNPGEEKVVANRSLSDGKDQLVLCAPIRFPNSPAGGVVIDLTVDAKGAKAQMIAAMKREIDAASSAATARMKQASPSSTDAGIAAALDAIASGQPQRGTLTYLANATGATLTAAVVLVADEKALDLIVGEIRSRLPNLPVRDRATVAWMLDRATIKAVASIKQEDSPTTLPPIIGALSAYGGEAGRQLDVLQSLADQAASSDDLYARITAEQYIDLEDSSPSIRVGAYDWLAQRGLAPPDYDPLGMPRDRRAALEKFSAASTQPTVSEK